MVKQRSRWVSGEHLDRRHRPRLLWKRNPAKAARSPQRGRLALPMNLTDPYRDRDGDKLREECGIFGVIGARDAAPIVALGLHALQHRGQEAVGITSFDGHEFFSRRGIGHVAANFSDASAI